MTNEILKQAVSNQLLAAKELPTISTVNNLPAFFPTANLTPAKIRSHIFRAEDRFDSRGNLIAGNGLAKSGAIVRRKGSRSILIDVNRYGDWLAGKGCVA
ncbi:MAG: hypothetical protein ABL880_05075 [Methylotenera sp.]